MATEIIAGWLKDKDGNKVAPKTLVSQVINDDGTTLNAVNKAGDEMTGMLKFKPANGTSVIATETYRNTSANSSKTRNVILSSGDAAMQLYKNALGTEPTTEANRLTLTDTDTQLMKPLTVASGGTGATTAVQALAKLKALNLDAITDNEFIVPSGADLNTYTTPGAYRVGTATIAGSLLNAPSYKSAGGRLIVTATSSTSGCFQFILYNTVNYQVWFRVQTSTGTWGEWEQLPTSNHMPDYVVAQGESNYWHYRKWKSGRAECWYCEWFTPTASGMTPATLTHSYMQSFTLPFKFTDIMYSVNATIQHGSGHGIITRTVVGSTSTFSVFWDGNSAINTADCRISVYVNGYYPL